MDRATTSDHRVAGSSPAGCKSSLEADIQAIEQSKTKDLIVEETLLELPGRRFAGLFSGRRADSHQLSRGRRRYSSYCKASFQAWLCCSFLFGRPCADRRFGCLVIACGV